VTLEGTRHRLGEEKPASFQRSYRLMQQPKLCNVASSSLVAVIDEFLEWGQKHRAPSNYKVRSLGIVLRMSAALPRYYFQTVAAQSGDLLEFLERLHDIPRRPVRPSASPTAPRTHVVAHVWRMASTRHLAGVKMIPDNNLDIQPQ
jgi:hypothetical protein